VLRRTRALCSKLRARVPPPLETLCEKLTPSLTEKLLGVTLFKATVKSRRSAAKQPNHLCIKVQNALSFCFLFFGVLRHSFTTTVPVVVFNGFFNPHIFVLLRRFNINENTFEFNTSTQVPCSYHISTSTSVFLYTSTVYFIYCFQVYFTSVYCQCNYKCSLLSLCATSKCL
jgi:hypothetical protein